MGIINRKTRGARVATVLMLGASITVFGASASHADQEVGIMACSDVGKVTYSVTPSATYKGDSSTRTYGQSGGTLTIALGESVTTGGSITGTTTAEAGAIFAKASVSVGVTIKKDWTNSVTRSYSWKVPKTQSTGWIEAGHRAYRVAYTKKTIVAPCNVAKKTGRILGNTSNIMFIHS